MNSRATFGGGGFVWQRKYKKVFQRIQVQVQVETGELAVNVGQETIALFFWPERFPLPQDPLKLNRLL